MKKMDFDKIISLRHCVRNFKKIKKPDYKDVISAIEAATKAPLAGNISSIKYVLVSDEKKISELAQAAQQSFIEQVHYVVVVCSDIKDLERNYYSRAKMYVKQQAGAAIENLILKLTDIGLSTCWVGAFSEETVKRILKIPDGIEVEALLPVGYEMGKGKQKAKPDLDRVMFFDGWGYEARFMRPRRFAPGSTT